MRIVLLQLIAWLSLITGVILSVSTIAGSTGGRVGFGVVAGVSASYVLAGLASWALFSGIAELLLRMGSLEEDVRTVKQVSRESGRKKDYLPGWDAENR